MEKIIQAFIPAYFLLFFLVAFAGKSLWVQRKTGKQVIQFPKDGSANSLVGFYFKWMLIALFAYSLIQFVYPGFLNGLSPVRFLENHWIRVTGILVMLFSFLWVVKAQMDMRDSWRIGIDKNEKTALIQQGLFRFSRNPIFLGMLMALTGLFAIQPNLLTLFFFILATVLIQIQIRLEEEYLEKNHGDQYLKYKKETKRML